MKIPSTPLVLVTAVASFAQFGSAFWRMNCGIIQTSRIDPIVSPGAVSGHVHKISGGSNIYLNSTTQSLQQSSCTSCEIQDDKSAYWTPQLYYARKNGSFQTVPNSGMVVYYLGRGENRSNVIPLPAGLAILSGNSAARAYDSSTYTFGGKTGMTYVGGTCTGNGTCVGGTWSNDTNASGRKFFGRPVSDRVSFNCLDQSPNPETPSMNNTSCANGLRAQLQLQSCWDGVNLYKSDNSHVAYMSQIDNGVCPPTHPMQLPHLFYEVLYGVNDIDTSDGGSFVFANGDPTGYGFHGDFLNGWKMDVQANAVQNCLNTDNAGQISACPALAASDSSTYGTNCPQLPSIVNEPSVGMLDKLPGCITITKGPDPAPPSSQSCPAGTAPPGVNPPSAQPGAPFVPIVNKTYGTWTYLGCGAEASNGRLLTGASTTSPNMTTELCQAFCASKFFPVAGTEYSTECYCGTLSSAVSTTPSCSNAMLCGGNRTEYCGAPSRLDLWNDTQYRPIQTVQSSNGYTFAGCYSDSGSRTLTGPSYADAQNMTVGSCVSYCAAKGFTYAGLEYAQECYCGNTIANGGVKQPDTSSCNMQCKGDPATYCGAGFRLDVYQKNSQAKKPVKAQAYPPAKGQQRKRFLA